MKEKGYERLTLQESTAFQATHSQRAHTLQPIQQDEIVTKTPVSEVMQAPEGKLSVFY